MRAASLLPISPLSSALLSPLSAQELAEILSEPPRVVPPIEPFSPILVALVSFPSPTALSPSFCRAKRGPLAPQPRSPEKFSAVSHGAAARALPRSLRGRERVPLALLSLPVVSDWKAARRSPLAADSGEVWADSGHGAAVGAQANTLHPLPNLLSRLT